MVMQFVHVFKVHLLQICNASTYNKAELERGDGSAI